MLQERAIVTKIMKYLNNLPECYAYKTHGDPVGIPDIVICYRGYYIALEVKTRTGKLSKIQEHMLKKIRKAKGQAQVVRSLSEVLAILRQYDMIEL